MGEKYVKGKDIKGIWAATLINTYNEKILNFIEKLNKVAPKGYECKITKMVFNILRLIKSDCNQGYHYSVFWSFPIKDGAIYSRDSWKKDSTINCIIFNLECTERAFNHPNLGYYTFIGKISKFKDSNIKKSMNSTFIFEELKEDSIVGQKLNGTTLYYLIRDIEDIQKYYEKLNIISINKIFKKI